MSRSDEAGSLLAEALKSLNISSSQPSALGAGVDLVIDTGHSQIPVQVTRMSSATSKNLATSSEEDLREGSAQPIRVLVADRITAEARDRLREEGWGWLDLRGHIYIAAQGMLLDSDTDSDWERPSRVDPLSGKAGLEVACLLLLRPGNEWTVRGIAREVHRSPSTVSEVLRGLRDEDLLGDRGATWPKPELFWRVADTWPSKRTLLANEPGLGEGPTNEALGLGLDDVGQGPGWALSDTLAASVYGAPIAVRSDQPPDFFVPNGVTLRRARQLLGDADSVHAARCTVRVAPVPAVCLTRIDTRSSSGQLPLAAPLFVALDLAQDAGRGREILEAWDPPEGSTRVW